MPRFLFTASYTQDGLKGLIKEGGTARRAAVEQLVESLDGTMEAFYWAFGDDDLYLIVELPDNEAAAATALTVTASGAASVKTVVLLTPEEIDEATKRSPAFRPPKS